MRFFGNTCAVLGLCLLALCHAVVAGSIPLEEGAATLPDCALSCFGTAIAQSTCAPTDASCLCGDKKFTNVVTACVKSSCTVKESLTARNVTTHLCDLPIEKDSSIVPLYCIFIGLAVVAVALRIAARILTHAYFWWDDFANLFGFVGAALFTAMNLTAIDLGQGTDIWLLPFDNVRRVLKMFFGEMLLYTMTRFFVRASIILFYLRIFPPSQDARTGRILQWTMAFNVVYNVSFLFAVIFQCRPISTFWTQWEGPHDGGEGHCGNANVLAWVAAATGLVFDLWLLALPFPRLLGLKLQWKKKVFGGMMFFVGAAVMIISLVRLKTINEFTRAVNPTKDIVQVCLWSGLELDVGVICPCLPSFRLLLRRLMPRAVGSTDRYTMDPVSNTTGARQSRLQKSFGGGGGDGAGGSSNSVGMNGGGIVVENTVDIKFRSGESTDGRSCASIKGLVETRASAEGRGSRGR